MLVGRPKQLPGNPNFTSFSHTHSQICGSLLLNPRYTAVHKHNLSCSHRSAHLGCSWLILPAGLQDLLQEKGDFSIFLCTFACSFTPWSRANYGKMVTGTQLQLLPRALGKGDFPSLSFSLVMEEEWVARDAIHGWQS